MLCINEFYLITVTRLKTTANLLWKCTAASFFTALVSLCCGDAAVHSEVCLLHRPRAQSADRLETPNPSSNCWTTEMKTFILYIAVNRESRFFSPGGQWPLTGIVDCRVRHRDRLYMRGGHNHFDLHIFGFICLFICLSIGGQNKQRVGLI